VGAETETTCLGAAVLGGGPSPSIPTFQ